MSALAGSAVAVLLLLHAVPTPSRPRPTPSQDSLDEAAWRIHMPWRRYGRQRRRGYRND